MSFTRDDDDMLDHEKWRRALREGGDGVLLVWWRLRAWCARRLTDGRIPADMVAEIACLGRSKSRARALEALVVSGLCERHIDGALLICGYLERNPSRAHVLSERDRRAQAQKKRRLTDDVTGHAETTHPERDDVPIPIPIPIPIPKSERDTRAPEESSPPVHPEVPGLTIVDRDTKPAYPGPLKPSKRDQAEAAGVPQQPPGLRYQFRPDWVPSLDHARRAQELGLTREEVFERAEDCLRKPIKHGFLDEDEHFFRELGWLKRDKETQRFKSKSERDAFENPGRERRPA